MEMMRYPQGTNASPEIFSTMLESCKDAISSSRLIIFVDNLDELYDNLPAKEGGL